MTASPAPRASRRSGAAVDEPDDGAAEVELVLAVDAGQLGGLAAEDRAAGRTADVGGALDQLCDLLRVDRAAAT